MNRERLLKLANHLDSVPPLSFNLVEWECGTTACAVGHACSIPEFKELGLHLVPLEHEPGFSCPVFGVLEDWEAVQNFFDLTYDQTNLLFYVDAYKSGWRALPSEVSQRIRILCGVPLAVEMPLQQPRLIKRAELIVAL